MISLVSCNIKGNDQSYEWIDKIEPWFSGSLRVTLKGGELRARYTGQSAAVIRPTSLLMSPALRLIRTGDFIFMRASNPKQHWNI